MPASKRAPAGLGARGRAFWKAILETYELTPAETEVLAESCRLLDEIDRLQAAVADGGVVVPGSVGQPRVHPAVSELRSHRLALGRLLAQLDLPDADGATLPSPASLRARRAAQSRWDRTAAIRAERRNRGSAAG